MERLKDILHAVFLLPLVCVGLWVLMVLVWFAGRTEQGREYLTELGDGEY